jgi:hypothetical protein
LIFARVFSQKKSKWHCWQQQERLTTFPLRFESNEIIFAWNQLVNAVAESKTFRDATIMQLVRGREPLVAALRQRGIDYLSPSDARLDRMIDDETLIASLASHSEARLRQALIAFFLLQPQLAPIALRVQAVLEPGAAQELLAYYTAAVYLQRMWRTRLGYYLDAVVPLPNYFSAELALPSPDDEHGKTGLYALADWQASRSAHRFNHLSAYEGVVDLLFQSLKMKRNQHEFARQS